MVVEICKKLPQTIAKRTSNSFEPTEVTLMLSPSNKPAGEAIAKMNMRRKEYVFFGVMQIRTEDKAREAGILCRTMPAKRLLFVIESVEFSGNERMVPSRNE